MRLDNQLSIVPDLADMVLVTQMMFVCVIVDGQENDAIIVSFLIFGKKQTNVKLFFMINKNTIYSIGKVNSSEDLSIFDDEDDEIPINTHTSKKPKLFI